MNKLMKEKKRKIVSLKKDHQEKSTTNLINKQARK